MVEPARGTAGVTPLPASIYSPPVRAVFLTHYYPPEVGAPQTRIAALTAGLARLGVETTVHTCFPHYPDGAIKAPYRNRLCEVEREGGVKVVRSAVYPAANRGFARRLGGHLSFAASALATARAAGPADVVVVETPPLFLAAAGIAYARSKRAALVVNVADLWPDSAIELGALRSPAAIAAARTLERAAYRSATTISCATEGIVAALQQRREASGKAALMRPAVDLDRFDPAADGGPAANGGPLRVLYAGTIGMAQGVDTLVEAAAICVDAVELTIAGGGAEAAALRAQLAERGTSNARMLGVVPSDRIPELYAASDVAVVTLRDRPIFHGALPTKMLEAMAAGRPLVLAARGEAAALVEASGAGIVVPPEDADALAEALRALAADPKLRARLGAAGRRAVERDFGRDDWLRRWHELLSRSV
jgi:glycosyltransferase involved in cell wall biosynthesis